jgi:hypothetical protein
MNKNLRTSRHLFRGVEYTIVLEPNGLWRWYGDDDILGLGNWGFASKENAAIDARGVINERVSHDQALRRSHTQALRRSI